MRLEFQYLQSTRIIGESDVSTNSGGYQTGQGSSSAKLQTIPEMIN